MIVCQRFLDVSGGGGLKDMLTLTPTWRKDPI